MNDRIKKLLDLVVDGKMRPVAVEPKYDWQDEVLPDAERNTKRVCEYIMAQNPVIKDESMLTGYMIFEGEVLGDIFTRNGHENFKKLKTKTYNQPTDNLVTFEWQHATGQFEKVIKIGYKGLLNEIEDSMKVHQNEPEKLMFLKCEKEFLKTAIDWAHKCSGIARKKAEEVTVKEYKDNLLKLSQGLMKVPENPADTFYEAILSLYVTYSFIPDSIGLIDRYLYPYYLNDKKNGILTDHQAKEYLQELYMVLQSRISRESDRFFRGGEAHFCIGGYNEKGEDVFNEFSKLVLDALMDMPMWIPQISFRWTKKTKPETFRYVLDCERKDKNKRLAFVNDEPRIKGLMKYLEYPYQEVVNYSMIGCNEISFPGGIVLGWDMTNIARSVANTFHNRKDDIVKAKTFDDFFKIYKEELFNDLNQAEKIKEKMHIIRSKDCNIVSSPFVSGCIKNGKSVTQGGCDNFIPCMSLIGITTVIDSLAIAKQFVYNEKIVTMEQLVKALSDNWQGHEDLRNMIMKNGNFFGNDDEISNEVSAMFTNALDQWNDGNNYLHKKYVVGNLIGYNEHNKFFGDNLLATPDGRYAGEMISFGIGQNNGKDRDGITSLLNSITKLDPCHLHTGSSVTNILLDKTLIYDDEKFEKTASILETYFKNGGTHFQLTYVDVEDMISAQKFPEKYKNLRVRVSGFSDYFVLLNTNLQNEIITRTKQYQ